ncbi:MAG: nitrate/nitrite transporter NrtS [Pseudomonadota bacterium]
MAPTHPDLSFMAIATQRSVRLRAIRIAAVVGVVLALLNHGDKIIAGAVDTMTVVKIALTFMVPYCVSTFSSVQAVRDKMQSLQPR